MYSAVGITTWASPALETRHPVGQYPGLDAADHSEGFGDQRQRRGRPLSVANPTTRHRAQNRNNPVRLGPTRSPDTHPATTPPGDALGDVLPQRLRLGNEVATVACRPVIADSRRDRLHPPSETSAGLPGGGDEPLAHSPPGSAVPIDTTNMGWMLTSGPNRIRPPLGTSGYFFVVTDRRRSLAC
jgi:hypothetical protein